MSKKTRSQLRDVETLLFLNQISEVSVSYLWIWVQEIAVLRGVYRVSGKEVTLHTISGNLYVYRSLIALDRRIGDFVRSSVLLWSLQRLPAVAFDLDLKASEIQCSTSR